MAGRRGRDVLHERLPRRPPADRDQIRSIRFRQNSFSADNHDAGRTQIEIITRPEHPMERQRQHGLASDVLNARKRCAGETPEQERTCNSACAVRSWPARRRSIQRQRQPAATTRRRSIALDEDGTEYRDTVRRPSEPTNFTAGHRALAERQPDAAAQLPAQPERRLEPGRRRLHLPERAIERQQRRHQARFRLQGLIGKTTLHEFRVQVNRRATRRPRSSSAPTIIVQDAFNKGGAGVNSHGIDRPIEIADNFDFNVGRKHQMRVGALLEGGSYRNFDERNTAGTFTYRNIEEYQRRHAAAVLAAHRHGRTSFSQYQVGLLLVGRVPAAPRLLARRRRPQRDAVAHRRQAEPDAAPRLHLGAVRQPASAVRGGYGLFYDWYDSSLYDQTLRVNGVYAARSAASCNPGYPDPFVGRRRRACCPSGRMQARPTWRCRACTRRRSATTAS